MNLKDIKEIRNGMSWGTREQGVEQLTERELFLLDIVETLEKKIEKLEEQMEQDDWNHKEEIERMTMDWE